MSHNMLCIVCKRKLIYDVISPAILIVNFVELFVCFDYFAKQIEWQMRSTDHNRYLE